MQKTPLFTQVLTAESAALEALRVSPPATTTHFMTLLKETTGKVVFSGLGKSWHVSQLLAATFSSVRIPAYALHGSESLHGDAGVLAANDTLVVISKSGRSTELDKLLRIAQERGCRTALLTCDGGSLAEKVDVVVQLPLQREAGEYALVPTSSLIVMVSFGHAVALQIAQDANFSPTHFAQVHPAGALGAALFKTKKEKE